MSTEFNGYLPEDESFATRAIHVAQEPEQWNSRALVPPITLSTTFQTQQISTDIFQAKNFSYGRLTNPSRAILENSIASLDNAKYASCFASGMAALSNTLKILKSGDQVLTASDVYGSTYNYMLTLATEQGLKTDFFIPQNFDQLNEKITKATKMIIVESPSNPSVHVVDLRKLAKICDKNDIILVVDNTFLTSFYQKPLKLGAHVAFYSLTKYMNGHSDVIMGAVVTNDPKIHDRLRFLQNYEGAIPAPFDCYMVSRGLKTLAIRMREHMKNGLIVANFLQNHRRVEKVLHPGLPSHPQHELFKSQCSGHSGMMAFYIKNATLENATVFLRTLKVIQFAGSLGGVESLVSCPALMSHVTLTAEERAKIGVADNLIRLSIGIETAADLTRDLDQALNAAFQ